MAFAAKRRLVTTARGRESISTLGGIAEGAETIALFVLVRLLPDRFAPLAWAFGGLCLVTTVCDVAVAVDKFRQPSRLDSARENR